MRADLSDLLDECGGTGEIAGTGLVPTSVIDRLSCNANVSIVLCGKNSHRSMKPRPAERPPRHSAAH